MKLSPLPQHILTLAMLVLCSGCFQQPQIWTDPKTGLTWQIKGKAADDPNFRGIIPIEAFEYCEQLELEDYTDWRLPRFSELRSIVKGNANVEVGGACQVGEPSAGTVEGKTTACASTGVFGDFGGPGSGGCYWKDGLNGTCDNIDPFGTHPYETLAADVANDKPDDWVAFVTFATGSAGYNHACSLVEVRCVRSSGPAPTCEVNGKPCHEYYRSKAYCDQDFTTVADTLRVTISLPQDPNISPPYQVYGFLYESTVDWFPPLGPPDGGTDYNQVFLSQPGAPQLDASTDYIMDIPGTTYYREALLNGDFQLFLAVQLENLFPPIPVSGDFVYGEGQTPILFPFDGSAHNGTVQEVAIELSLVGCPVEKPVACWDRSCAVDEISCPTAVVCPPNSSCFPNCPDDGEIYTCRYNNFFAGSDIAMLDYPQSEGWTYLGAIQNCSEISGASNPVIVQGQGQSALVQLGGIADGRCVFTDSLGRHSIAQGIGTAICSLGEGVWEPTGPYCNLY